MTDYMTTLDGPLGVLIAGAAGAVALTFLHAASAKERGAELLSGIAVALFVAPAVIAHWFSAASVEERIGVAFAVGCFGPILAGAAVRAIERRADALANKLVNRVVGKED